MRMKREALDGVPIARIARRYGVSCQSVYNELKSPSEVELGKVRPSKLEPFKGFIRDRLDEFDLPATVLLREIRELGYAGGITIVKEFVSTIKQESVRQVIERFEILPGQQAQVDWGECGTILEHGESKRLYLFVFVLGYSRVSFARFTTSTKQSVLLSCLREAFERHGVPKKLLVDNMKTAVDRNVLGEEVRFNRGFLDFCEHYGTLPVTCPPYWPKAKWKVEAGVKYVKTSFLTGLAFTTLEDLNQQLDAWLDQVANVRVHGTTGERPIDRYADEIVALRPAATVPRFDTRELLLRKVQSDSHVRLADCAFSVPPHAVGRMGHIRLRRIAPGEAFEVLLNGEVLATQQLPISTREKRVTLPEHEASIRVAAGHSRNPRKPRKTYQQTQVDPGSLTSSLPAAPVVQTRSLAEYERMLKAVS